MSEIKTQPVKVKVGAEASFVKERLIWASRPLGLLVLALWILHPATGNGSDVVHLALMGFLAGTAYGLVLYGRKLRSYTSLKADSLTQTPNRVPAEYYWGSIAQVMYDNS